MKIPKRGLYLAALMTLSIFLVWVLHQYTPQTKLLTPVLAQTGSAPDWLSQSPGNIQTCLRGGSGSLEVLGKADKGDQSFYLVGFTQFHQPLQEVDQLIVVHHRGGCQRLMDATSKPMPISAYAGDRVAADLENQRVQTYLTWMDGNQQKLSKYVGEYLKQCNGEYWLSKEQVSALKNTGALITSDNYKLLAEDSFKTRQAAQTEASERAFLR